MRSSAALDPPIKASASMSPVFMRNGMVSRPRPDTKFMAPGGKARAKASTKKLEIHCIVSDEWEEALGALSSIKTSNL